MLFERNNCLQFFVSVFPSECGLLSWSVTLKYVIITTFLLYRIFNPETLKFFKHYLLANNLDTFEDMKVKKRKLSALSKWPESRFKSRLNLGLTISIWSNWNLKDWLKILQILCSSYGSTYGTDVKHSGCSDTNSMSPHSICRRFSVTIWNIYVWISRMAYMCGGFLPICFFFMTRHTQETEDSI